ncbi:hypothetical protein DFH06DRAFT_1138487 [Mycena polygramma]|nr:hypothetical protein DFH06DRAFT_1138487 [Mycena polygramma]
MSDQFAAKNASKIRAHSPNGLIGTGIRKAVTAPPEIRRKPGLSGRNEVARNAVQRRGVGGGRWRSPFLGFISVARRLSAISSATTEPPELLEVRGAAQNPCKHNPTCLALVPGAQRAVDATRSGDQSPGMTYRIRESAIPRTPVLVHVERRRAQRRQCIRHHSTISCERLPHPAHLFSIVLAASRHARPPSVSQVYNLAAGRQVAPSSSRSRIFDSRVSSASGRRREAAPKALTRRIDVRRADLQSWKFGRQQALRRKGAAKRRHLLRHDVLNSRERAFNPDLAAGRQNPAHKLNEPFCCRQANPSLHVQLTESELSCIQGAANLDTIFGRPASGLKLQLHTTDFAVERTRPLYVVSKALSLVSKNDFSAPRDASDPSPRLFPHRRCEHLFLPYCNLCSFPPLMNLCFQNSIFERPASDTAPPSRPPDPDDPREPTRLMGCKTLSTFLEFPRAGNAASTSFNLAF